MDSPDGPKYCFTKFTNANNVCFSYNTHYKHNVFQQYVPIKSKNLSENIKEKVKRYLDISTVMVKKLLRLTNPENIMFLDLFIIS